MIFYRLTKCKYTHVTGEVLQLRVLKRSAVPHIFPWKASPSSAKRERVERGRERERKRLKLDDETAWRTVGATVEIEESENIPEVQTEELELPKLFTDSQTQTDRKPFTARDFSLTDRLFHKLTGLVSYSNFSMVLSTFGDDIEGMNYYYGWTPTMQLEDQFFLTLIRLRMNKPIWEIAMLFKLSEKEVSNIFITWINFLYFHFKDIDWWPSRDTVQYFSPKDFRRKFPTTRVIIDGTEVPLKKPKAPLAQQATYSTYKNRNTVKALIGVTPGGMVSYVSDVYGGSTSDRQICERSELTRIIESGDSIMADKGFNVQDIFMGSNVLINIPEFFKKKTRMSERSLAKDRKIASKRVHVERVIGLAKTFKILRGPLSVTDAPLADAIITTCFFLCNYRPCIVPKHA